MRDGVVLSAPVSNARVVNDLRENHPASRTRHPSFVRRGVLRVTPLACSNLNSDHHLSPPLLRF
jgi:hypothetical protein